MEKEVASEQTKHVVHPINVKELESRIWWSQSEASQIAWWSFTTRNHVSTSISERKMAAVMPAHWNPTADNETCSTKTLNSARLEALDSRRLGCASVQAFLRAAIASGQIDSAASLRVWLDSTRLDSTRHCWCGSIPARGHYYRGAGKPLDRPGRKRATATEDFDVHISYL